MYGFPEDLDLGDVLGSEIQQICLGRGDIQFVFGSGRRICTQGLVEVFKGAELVSRWEAGENWSSTAFQHLLMVTIERYAVLDERLLEIGLRDDLRLHLHDDSTQFETVQIYPEHIVV